MSRALTAAVLALAALALAACTSNDEPAYGWALPVGFPEPAVPRDNPMSAEKVELGRHLFYDTRLSINGTTSCATCHLPDKAFADGKALPEGATPAAVCGRVPRPGFASEPGLYHLRAGRVLALDDQRRLALRSLHLRQGWQRAR